MKTLTKILTSASVLCVFINAAIAPKAKSVEINKTQD